MATARTYWIDRCLGGDILPRMLRDAGIDVRTYADLYPNDPKVPDHVWIPEVAARDWVILTKDKTSDARRLRFKPSGSTAAM